MIPTVGLVLACVVLAVGGRHAWSLERRGQSSYWLGVRLGAFYAALALVLGALVQVCVWIIQGRL